MDVAPYLTRKIVDYHFDNGQTPIVIYPEIYRISRFSAPVRVRYVLNYDDLLFRNESLENDDYLLFYSTNIASKVHVDKPASTIFLPVSDHNFYCPPVEERRNGGVFYAGKFKYHFSGKTFPVTDGMPEITRDQPNSQTPEQIRSLFQNAEFFYCYEDSALALEAMLCGCPVVFLANDHFQQTLAAEEMAGLGYAWGNSLEQMNHAKSTVKQVRERYLFLLDQAGLAVKTFIHNSQSLAEKTPFKTPFAVGFLTAPSTLQKILDLMRFFREVVQDQGIRKTIRIMVKRLRSGRMTLH
ncbi:MAG: hypothetical protein ACYC9L_02570 [Sulfuricaulis sp.]